MAKCKLISAAARKNDVMGPGLFSAGCTKDYNISR